MIRILFMGGKQIGFEVCKYLLNVKDHEVKFVVNEYESLGSWYTTPRELPIDEITIDQVASFDPDLIIVAFYDKILKKPLISEPRLGSWNIHLADAEKYRGAHPNIWALRNGDTSYGVTLHKIDEGIDTGPILSKQCFPITKNCTGKELYDLMMKAGAQLFIDCFDDLISGKALQKVKPQSSEGAVTHYRKELSLELKVTEDLKNQVRALTFPPFSPPYFKIGTKKFIIVEERISGAGGKELKK